MPHKLLLADDSVTIQRVIELTFADEDVQVVAVSDGDQAIARLASDPPDIVLADVGMPGKNGYEVASYIKQTPALAHIPVLLLTGAFEPVDQVKADAAGCDGVLAKPFEPQMVIGRVKELLGRPARPAAPLDAHLAAPPAPASEPSWQAGPIEPAAEPPHAQTSGPADLDNYFDQLDAAFANLSGSPKPTPAPVVAPPMPESGRVGDEIDWFAITQQPQPNQAAESRWDLPIAAEAPAASRDLPLSYGSPQGDFDRLPAAAPRPQADARRPIAAPAPMVPVAAPSLPDAFAAILAAEQQAADPSAAAGWPAETPEISDTVVEEVVRRVLDRLTDRVVRETVTDVVSRVAERLVHDEIERIKSSVQ